MEKYKVKKCCKNRIPFRQLQQLLLQNTWAYSYKWCTAAVADVPWGWFRDSCQNRFILWDTSGLLCTRRGPSLKQSTCCSWWLVCKLLVCSCVHSRRPSSPHRTGTSGHLLRTPAGRQSRPEEGGWNLVHHNCGSVVPPHRNYMTYRANIPQSSYCWFIYTNMGAIQRFLCMLHQ